LRNEPGDGLCASLFPSTIHCSDRAHGPGAVSVPNHFNGQARTRMAGGS
jgi:hypothetical protein